MFFLVDTFKNGVPFVEAFDNLDDALSTAEFFWNSDIFHKSWRSEFFVCYSNVTSDHSSVYDDPDMRIIKDFMKECS